MSMTDPIADLLTRIRNGCATGRKSVKVPFSHLKQSILRVLKEQGYIVDFAPEMEGTKGILRIELKYGPDGEQVLRSIRRVSKPGRRVFKSAGSVPVVLNGMGITVLSTSRGVLSNSEAKKLNVGGEVLCEVW